MIDRLDCSSGASSDSLNDGLNESLSELTGAGNSVERSVTSSSKSSSRSLQCGERLLSLSAPQIMAVLNVTPDSFSDGGALLEGSQVNLDKVLLRVEQVLDEGAAIIDVGGESTRPGAAPVSLQQEMDRVLPVIEAIAARFDTVISLDSSSPSLMLTAAECGAGLLNDVRALERPGAVEAAAKTGLPICLMHMQGQPATMQYSPNYQSVVEDVSVYLLERAEQCRRAGIDAGSILLDPGFGFGKSVQHNLMLLNRLPEIIALGFPVLVGLSRKSLIGKVLGRELGQRLAGSLGLALMAAERGASILRVHDVAETSDVIRLLAAVKQS